MRAESPRGRTAMERRLTLADEEADADARHVEAVEPVLDVEVDGAGVLGALPLEHALGDGGHGGVVALLDGLEKTSEGAVIFTDFGGPFRNVRRVCIVSGPGMRGK